MRECSADGDMNKKQSQRDIAQVHRRIQLVEFSSQQQGADRHGGGLSDKRTQQWADRQNGKPPRCRGFSAEVGEFFQRSLGKL